MQGQSNITPIKEIQIHGVVKMRLQQRKNQKWIKQINVYDVFCGDGENIVNNETIQGSPLEICDAINESGVNAFFIASDIKKSSCEYLQPLLTSKASDDFFTKKNFIAMQNKASDQMDIIIKYLSYSERNHAIIVVDPNGPGVMPFDKMLYIMTNYSKQADMLINISETAINRILGCGITKDKNWWKKYDSFISIIWSIFSKCKGCWLRQPMIGDCQRWRFVCCWSFAPPKNDWIKQDLIKINTKNDLINLIGEK